jgi:hypothetical protein
VHTALLNRYFREYHLKHGQGGTHTLQRNLIQMCNFLERERDFAVVAAYRDQHKVTTDDPRQVLGSYAGPTHAGHKA